MYVPASNVISMSIPTALPSSALQPPRYLSFVIGTPRNHQHTSAAPQCRVQPPIIIITSSTPLSSICLSGSPRSTCKEFRQLGTRRPALDGYQSYHACKDPAWPVLHKCVMHHSLCINTGNVRVNCKRVCKCSSPPTCHDILTFFQHRYSERLFRRHPAFLHDHTAGALNEFAPLV